MKCIAQDVHDEQYFWIRLHGGKTKESRKNFRKHVQNVKNNNLDKANKKKVDDLAHSLFRKQERLGRERTGN